jgi:hypothetical protein
MIWPIKMLRKEKNDRQGTLIFYGDEKKIFLRGTYLFKIYEN